jgi:hypothetical protein
MRRSVDGGGGRTSRRHGARRGRALGIAAVAWLGLAASAGSPTAAAAGEGAVTGGAAAVDAAATTEAREPTSPRWGIGWDGDLGGLLLRYRWRDVWQFGLSAGPDDDKDRTDYLEWDSGTPGDTARAGRQEYRRESGWVRATAGRRFWRQDGLSLSADLGVGYRWAHSQSVWRDPMHWSGGALDVLNRSFTTDSGRWQVSLLLRPAYALGARFSVEWECGLFYERVEESRTTIEWYDVDPAHSRDEDDENGHSFYSYGWLDYHRLKLIFWF